MYRLDFRIAYALHEIVNETLNAVNNATGCM